MSPMLDNVEYSYVSSSVIISGGMPSHRFSFIATFLLSKSCNYYECRLVSIGYPLLTRTQPHFLSIIQKVAGSIERPGLHEKDKEKRNLK